MASGGWDQVGGTRWVGSGGWDQVGGIKWVGSGGWDQVGGIRWVHCNIHLTSSILQLLLLLLLFYCCLLLVSYLAVQETAALLQLVLLLPKKKKRRRRRSCACSSREISQDGRWLFTNSESRWGGRRGGARPVWWLCSGRWSWGRGSRRCGPWGGRGRRRGVAGVAGDELAHYHGFYPEETLPAIHLHPPRQVRDRSYVYT